MNREWFRGHLLDDLMPRWLAVSQTPNGLFRSHFRRDWTPGGDDTATLVSQCRLLYNFATAFRWSGDARYRDAVARGAGALLRCFRRPGESLWIWSVSLDGSPRDRRLDLYGHAFVLFGLAHAHEATGDERFRAAAVETLRAVRSAFRDSHGGWIPCLDPRQRDTGSVRSQNPIMHLFEALLALAAMGERDAANLAQEVALFVTQRLMRRGGVLPELFTHDWQELDEAGGGRIDVGHQFEWAFLLSRAAETGVLGGLAGGAAVTMALQMVENGLCLGWDHEHGGVWSPVSPGGVVLSRAKGWWEQCEAARALLHMACVRGKNEYRPLFENVLNFSRARLIDERFGGWYMRVEPDGSIPNTDKGNVWKVDYHVVGLCDEALRLLT